MIVYRLSHPQYADDFTGMGSFLHGGRWNSVGKRVLYTSQTSSLAILEVIVHLKGATIPPYQMVEMEISPDKIYEPKSIKPQSMNQAETRQIGDHWIDLSEFPVMKVPSIVNSMEDNYLLNPLNAELSIEVRSSDFFMMDDRLIRR